jgi:hypothetical protein
MRANDPSRRYQADNGDPASGPAEALDWRPIDLLGWDVQYPYSPIARRLGLVWKIDGAAVVEVRRDEIVIERVPGFHTLVPKLVN